MLNYQFHYHHLTRQELRGPGLELGMAVKPYAAWEPAIVHAYRGVRPISVYWRLVLIDPRTPTAAAVAREGVSISFKEAVRGARQWVRKLGLIKNAMYSYEPQLYLDHASPALVPLNFEQDVLEVKGLGWLDEKMA